MSNEGAKKLSAKRKDALMIDPTDLVVVTDPKHELFDERALQPIDPAFKATVKRYGVKTPIQIRYNGKREDGTPIAEVVDGRQRVRSAAEINEEEGWEGDDRILVPCMIWRGTEQEATASMVLLNEARKDDDVWIKAQKAKRLLDRGMTTEDVALVFKRGVPTIERWLRLFDCSAEVLVAVEHEGLTVDAALKLTALPRAEQTVALDEMRSKGELTGKPAVEAAEQKATRGKGRKKKQKRARPYKELDDMRREMLDKKQTRFVEGILAGIAFAMGDKLEDE